MEEIRGRDGDFLAAATSLVKAANGADIPLKLLGSVAIRLRSGQRPDLCEDLNRPLTDVDVVTYSRYNRKLRPFFETLGYRQDEMVARYFGAIRHVYYSEEWSGLHVDVFFGKLSFCHEIDFLGRLDGQGPTVSLTDLLLEKAQIVEINEKDLKDLSLLLCTHDASFPPSSIDSDDIDISYVAGRMSNDWGFYHTFSMTMGRLIEYVEERCPYQESDKNQIRDRVGKLVAAVDACKKTAKWKMRARIGTKRKWYTEVEEVDR